MHMGAIDRKRAFIEKAEKLHNGKYNYDQVNYTNSKTKVIIICPTHGEFTQSPSNHLYRKAGCPKCANNVVLTNAEFIDRAKAKHNNQYLYQKVDYHRSKSKVIITCRVHGDFEQTANDHLNGHGCSECSFENHPGRLCESVISRDTNLALSPRSVYLFKLTNGNTIYWKIGISNQVEKRLRHLSNEYQVELIDIIDTTTYNAVIIENRAHDFYKSQGAVYDFSGHINGGRTECFRFDQDVSLQQFI